MLLSSNVMRYVILGTMNDLSLSLFEDTFVCYKRSLVEETILPEWIIILESENSDVKIFKLSSVIE